MHLLNQEIYQTDDTKNCEENECTVWMCSKITCRRPIWLFTLVFRKSPMKVGDISRYNGED